MARRSYNHTNRKDRSSLESYVWIYVREGGLNLGVT